MNELTYHKKNGQATTMRKQGKLPEGMRQVLCGNNRKKVRGNAARVWRLHNYMMRVRENWPALHGYYVLINKMEANKEGYENLAQKERARTMVTVLCPDGRAEEEFQHSLGMDRFTNDEDGNDVPEFNILTSLDNFNTLFKGTRGNGGGEGNEDGEGNDA